jgi:AcrR family transcriptional regulator
LSKPVKRSYDSSRRKEQARETRRRILRAASELFIAKGYGQTTIADIARAADVAPETVYAAFKTKANVLHRVWDVTIGGDDEDVKYHERPEIMAIRDEPDLAARLRMQAPVSTAAARRMAPFTRALHGAAASEPAAAEMLAEMDRQRYEGLGVMAREAAKTGQLKVSEQECRDFMWATTDGTLWHRLVAERGWTDERYAEWLGAMWVAALVGPRRRPRPS